MHFFTVFNDFYQISCFLKFLIFLFYNYKSDDFCILNFCVKNIFADRFCIFFFFVAYFNIFAKKKRLKKAAFFMIIITLSIYYYVTHSILCHAYYCIFARIPYDFAPITQCPLHFFPDKSSVNSPVSFVSY